MAKGKMPPWLMKKGDKVEGLDDMGAPPKGKKPMPPKKGAKKKGKK